MGVFCWTTIRAMSVVVKVNKVFLYENGWRITDNSVLSGEYPSDPVCKGGICYVTQGLQSVTFYKTLNTRILNYEAWINNWYLTHKGCEWGATKEAEVTATLEEWRNSAKFAEFQKRVIEAQTTEQRKEIWAESDPYQIEFMKQKGFSNYGSTECTIPLSDFDNKYIPEIFKNTTYKITINFPPEPQGSAETTYNVDMATGKFLPNNPIQELTSNKTYLLEGLVVVGVIIAGGYIAFKKLRWSC
jgi:hypothetical protein